MGLTEVKADVELTPQEREFTLRVAQDEDEVQVFSEIPALMNRLMSHPAFNVQWVRYVDGSVKRPMGSGSGIPDGVLVAVAGTLPVRCVSVSDKGRRNHDGLADIITAAVLDGEANDR